MNGPASENLPASILNEAAMEDNEVGGASRNAKAEGSGVMLVGLRLTDSRLIGLELVLESPGLGLTVVY